MNSLPQNPLRNLDKYFSVEELERLKQLPPLSQEEEEYLHKLANAIIDRLEEEIKKGRLQSPKE